MEWRNSRRSFGCAVRGRVFTLLELLVVVAIIMIVASLLMPAALRVLAKARGVVCTANLKQMAVGMMDYAEEFDGYVCPALPGDPVGHWLNYTCVEALDGNPTVLQCPELDGDDLFNPYGGVGKYGILTQASYIMNIIRESEVNGWSGLPAQISTPFSVSFGWIHGTASKPVRMRWVRDPGGKLWITDSAPKLMNPATSLGILRMTESDHGWIDPNADDQVNAGERQVGWQHDDGFNVLFGDTHVEYRRHSEHEEWNVHQVQ